MSRQGRAKDSTAPTLFPFLAVLLCTMGSLVLILMLLVADAQDESQQAVERARLRQEEEQATMELARRSYATQLEQGRLELERKRLQLEHFEAHIRELTEELTQLAATLEATRHRDTLDPADSAKEREQTLTALQRELAEAEEELKKKLDDPTGDHPVFAIIPYQGRNGTHRRPIYLECTADGVVVQPEGVLLSIADLQPPYGPGNPLDAVLRTIRSEFKPKNGALTETAYPLLIVRPSGIRTYALARSAMDGWDDQFGYELVDETLPLEFPESAPGLKEKIVHTIQLARQRQAALLAAMPRKYRSRDRGLPLGDVQPDSANQAGSGGRGWEGGPSPLAAAASREANGGSGMEDGRSNTAAWPSAERLASSGNSITATFDQPGGMRTNSSEPLISGSTPHGGAGLPVPSDVVTDSSPPPHAGPTAGGEATAEATASTGSQALASSAAHGSMRGQGNTPTPASGTAGGRGGYQAIPSHGSAASADPTTPRPSVDDETLSTANTMSLTLDRTTPSPPPLAERKGSHWAWEAPPLGRTEIARPIQVHCFADQWIIVPEGGNVQQAIRIPTMAEAELQGDHIAAAIQREVHKWGMAVLGGVWKPVLHVTVAPGAEAQFRRLVHLMTDSGVEVIRVEPPEVQRQATRDGAPSSSGRKR
ncbi:MAG: hypothetical protein KatS3mg111_2778 [Pirellulaceae bacterium]|nr:MAG: hypothetical protein KatS3mg111_2778 [Pirellulaceae bacterium]